jgi:hypothetical protein
MSDLFSSLLIFTLFKTILNTFIFTVSKFYKNLVKWALTEMLCSVAGTTTLDRECKYRSWKKKMAYKIQFQKVDHNIHVGHTIKFHMCKVQTGNYTDF